MPTAITGARTVINDDATIEGVGLSIRGYHVNGTVTITNLDQSELVGVYARDGFIIKGDVGAGVYHNSFIGLHTGLDASGPAKGFQIYTVDPMDVARVNNNVFVGCSARFCATVGYEVLRASGNTFIGCGAESNGKGMTIDDAVRITIVGGHFETNTTTDVELNAGASHIRMFGPCLLNASPVTGANKDATGNIYEEGGVFSTIGTSLAIGHKSNWLDLIKADESTIRLNSE
jgi:hypothetical protein